MKGANQYVLANHRHNSKVLVHRFSIACYDDDRLCGVAIVGNPSARLLDDGKTVEVKRLCTDGTKNACSILYGRCARIAKDMGFEKIITYTLEEEGGASLRASGFLVEATGVGGKRGWDTPSRPRVVHDVTLFGEVTASYPLGEKIRWFKNL